MSPDRFDVVIVGGAVMGSATAFFLSRAAERHRRILVLEKDPTYSEAASSRSTSGFRQQFSTRVNVELARYSAEFILDAERWLGLPGEPAGVPVCEAGYLYLGGPEHVAGFQRNHALQRALGVDVALLDRGELRARFPWLNGEDVEIASLGLRGEGWFDGYLLMSAFRRCAQHAGVEYRQAEAAEFRRTPGGGYVIQLADGDTVATDQLVNTAGVGAPRLAATLGVELPVRAVKQTVFAFRSPFRAPNMPYLFTPDGVFCRPDGADYIAGIAIGPDAAEAVDLEVDHDVFDERLWPLLAQRAAGFEELRFKSAWAGWYDMSLFDHNPFIGGVEGLPGYVMATGFSGHGIMQSPAIGRALSELILHGAYQTIDLSDLRIARIADNAAVLETIQY